MFIPDPALRLEDAARLRLDEHGMLAEDLPCRKCSYNLRGLSPEGRCPECGTAVGLSTLGDLLRYADPNWIRTVARGITIILWMILASVLLGCLGGTLLATEGLQQALSIGLGLVSFYGVWLMTEPDPSGLGEDPTITARKVIRFALLVGIGAQVLTLATEQLSPPGAVLIVFAVLGVIATLIGLVGEFAKFTYYEYLLRRVPDPKLAGRARFLKWGFVVCLGIMLLGGILTVVNLALSGATGAGPGLGPVTGVMFLMLPAGIGMLVFGILTLLLLLRLRQALLTAAESAEAVWSVAGGIPAVR